MRDPLRLQACLIRALQPDLMLPLAEQAIRIGYLAGQSRIDQSQRAAQFQERDIADVAGQLRILGRSAARASRRVESSTGNGEFASFMISGISVQPSTTASQPESFIRPITCWK